MVDFVVNKLKKNILFKEFGMPIYSQFGRLRNLCKTNVIFKNEKYGSDISLAVRSIILMKLVSDFKWQY